MNATKTTNQSLLSGMSCDSTLETGTQNVVLTIKNKQTIGNNMKTATYLTITSSAVIALAIYPELALAAAKFDINAGVAAATTPLITGISDHWGKAVLLTGCGGAIIGEGDARQRAVRAAITSAAAGGVVLALLAMLT